MDLFKKVSELKEKHIPCALVTVIDTRGSVPRNSGAKMLVEINGTTHGTIGGSSVEQLAAEDAMDVIRKGVPRRVSHNLHDFAEEDTGMVCGGEMEFFIEPIVTGERVFIFGGGHIALSLARHLPELGFAFTVIDDRSGFASRERFPTAFNLMQGDPGKIGANLDLNESDYIIIVTHGHKHDYIALQAVINKPCKYLGMIGSISKRNTIYKKLKENDQIGNDLIKKVHCPIGLKIHAETPDEIAISILAEMIKVRYSKG